MKNKKSALLFLLIYSNVVFSLSQVFFTPRDDIKKNLIDLIKHERKSIEAAVYMFTDKQIAQSLVDAYMRGVKVSVILDQVSMDRFGKGQFLQNNGVSVFVHRTEAFNPFSSPIMHHKFFIFGMNDIYKRSLVWTGSFNCTVSASKINDENVLVSDDLAMIQEYQECFNRLMRRLS